MASLPCGSACPGRLVLPMGDDMHTHLRQGKLMEAVTPLIRRGGCNRVVVMPNTIPPIVTCGQALAYREKLLQQDSKVDYLMTLYLSPEVDCKDILENAKKSHVVGVKLYPRGVTTNSDSGVEVSY
ncbi:putative dihydroorotase protein [Cyclospora cayetanensis]|uniref:Dihydroorotase protein n=1 Tax=Cyclospora cayetanensis TaxID=88456 RepID=A0A1D3D7A9_9EIME|nr:putative dihydroorotase protein [Cyclospora cayetanensis]